MGAKTSMEIEAFQSSSSSFFDRRNVQLQKLNLFAAITKRTERTSSHAFRTAARSAEQQLVLDESNACLK